MQNACYASPALKEWISTLLLLSCPDSDTSRAYPRPFLFGGTGVLASPLPVSSAASAAGLGYQLPNQRHFLQRIPVTGKKVKPQRRCIVCKDAGVRRESRFYCSACPGGPGFCRTGPCFMTHHRMMGCIFDKHLLIWRKIWTENILTGSVCVWSGELSWWEDTCAHAGYRVVCKNVLSVFCWIESVIDKMSSTWMYWQNKGHQKWYMWYLIRTFGVLAQVSVHWSPLWNQ